MFPLATMVNKCYTNNSLTGITYCFFGGVGCWGVFFGAGELAYNLISDVILCQLPQTFVQAQLRDNTRAGDSQVEGRRQD